MNDNIVVKTFVQGHFPQFILTFTFCECEVFYPGRSQMLHHRVFLPDHFIQSRNTLFLQWTVSLEENISKYVSENCDVTYL